MDLKVLTLNLHSWQESDQLNKFSRIAQFIAKNRIDIVAFQEVSQHKDAPLLKGNIRNDNAGHLIMQELNRLSVRPYTMHWDWSHYGWDVYEEGVAVLTFHPVVDVASKYVSQSKAKDNWKSRNIIRVGVDLKDEVLDVFSCHTGWWEDAEEPFDHQCRSLCLFTEERPNRSLLMGDFNNPAGSPGHALLTKKYTDLFPLGSTESGFTMSGDIEGYEGNKVPLRIDYIFTDQSISSVKAEVVFSSDPVSDHFGVTMKLTW